LDKSTGRYRYLDLIETEVKILLLAIERNPQANSYVPVTLISHIFEGRGDPEQAN
jgi:hypothetical protein